MSPHGVHRYVYITLKKSLRWVPVVGWVSASPPAHAATFDASLGHAILQVHLPRPIMGLR